MQGKPADETEMSGEVRIDGLVVGPHMVREYRARLATYEAALREIDKAATFPWTVDSLRLTVSRIARMALGDA